MDFTNFLLSYITAYFADGFILVCLLVWGWTLKKLYKDVQDNANLLPNIKIFRIHAALLVLFLFFNFGAMIAVIIFNQKKNDPST